ncbi:glycine/sarcosine/betaine reductase component B subunit [Ihubacter massiliensis]|uniref:Glycine/sarcosine/betaine reductase component B subunit n=1 Tax=Hominibacterium faecale TaxID=2839743 RepID=A0A9J6QV62_9FIRM|nr:MULTISPECIES: glycine/sarcosine/betaine reductase component B subunit [Eubacteriales Family XIII. Incertae Sedis]MCO7124051.1 glycine/sarcosine/betaine reductase component B subunit [Ihubacter massiliensis]MCU7379043.1 glycine/sarcosine/betaine reductase component B subunit [Hominibacterium faecale]
MRLELGNIPIRDIQFGVKSKIEGDVLYVNKEELQALLAEDQALESVELELAKPGDSTRIMPVKDVIEPRVKVKGDGGVFPGTVSKVGVVGSGRTNVLKGAAVVTTGKVVGFQEGLIDMSGIGAEYTPFSKLNNLVLVCQPAAGVSRYEHEKALRFAGLKAAAYLGELARHIESQDVEAYQTYGLREGIEAFPHLPRVGYVLMLQSQGLMHDTYVYGVDMKQSLPTILSPTEIMDGAIVSGNCVSACDKNTTYHHLNNPVIADLFKEHGKTLNFTCVIITNENVYLADKERSSDWTAKLARQLDLDGVIISQEGFGNPDTDLMMNCKKIEASGIDTVIITDEYAGRDGASQSLADGDQKADAVISCGNANELIHLGPMEQVIGYAPAAGVISGGFDGSLKSDGSMTVELQAITGATNELGFNKLSAR